MRLEDIHESRARDLNEAAVTNLKVKSHRFRRHIHIGSWAHPNFYPTDNR